MPFPSFVSPKDAGKLDRNAVGELPLHFQKPILVPCNRQHMRPGLCQIQRNLPPHAEGCTNYYEILVLKMKLYISHHEPSRIIIPLPFAIAVIRNMIEGIFGETIE